MDLGEKFKPVEDGSARSMVMIDGTTVHMVDNRPTYEGETIGTANGPGQAAAMLIEAGVAEIGEEQELIALIEHGIAQAITRPVE